MQVLTERAEAALKQGPIPAMRLRFRLTMGEDLGQHIGTIFEARGLGDEPAVCRAGASASAQTRAGFDARTIEFTCGIDSHPAERIVVGDLGKPNPHTNRPEIRLVSGKLVEIASGSILENGTWITGRSPLPEGAKPAHWIQMVGNDPLYFSSARNAIMYRGKPILDFKGSWRNSLYYGGRLYLSHYDVATESGELLVCRWRPGEERCVEERRHPWPYQRDLYGMIGWRGGVYLSASDAQDGEGAAIWRVTGSGIERFFPRAVGGRASRGEFYGMTLLNDLLVAGHYRTGRIVALAHDGTPRSLLSAPPFPREILGGRPGDMELSEAQTLLIHGGKIWIGTFPWGLLWSGSPDLTRWSSVRLFDGPPLDRSLGPLHGPLNRDLVSDRFRDNPKFKADPRWLFASMWSQRIHNAAPWRDGVAFSLTNMAGSLYDAERDRHAPKSFYRSYGRIAHVRGPTTISHTIKWPESGTIDMTFEIVRNRLRMLVDGALVAERPITGFTFSTLDFLVDRVGEGLYGKSEIGIRPLL